MTDPPKGPVTIKGPFGKTGKIPYPKVILTEGEWKRIAESLKPVALSTEQAGWLRAKVIEIRTELRIMRAMWLNARPDRESVRAALRKAKRIAERMRVDASALGELYEPARWGLAHEGVWDDENREALLVLAHQLGGSVTAAERWIAAFPREHMTHWSEHSAALRFGVVFHALTGRPPSGYEGLQAASPFFQPFLDVAFGSEGTGGLKVSTLARGVGEGETGASDTDDSTPPGSSLADKPGDF